MGGCTDGRKNAYLKDVVKKKLYNLHKYCTYCSTAGGKAPVSHCEVLGSVQVLYTFHLRAKIGIHQTS